MFQCIKYLIFLVIYLMTFDLLYKLQEPCIIDRSHTSVQEPHISRECAHIPPGHQLVCDTILKICIKYVLFL